MKNESSELPFVDAPLRVRYAETDQMGIAYHANHVVWFEVGRTELCRAAGMVYRELEKSGYLLVVAEVGVRYGAPARYDDELFVRTRIGEVGSRGLRFDYELRRKSDDALLASGFTRHVFCDAKSRKPTRAPDEARSRFGRFLPAANGGVGGI
jgi:acyl-CoA thioester hydrolase